MNLPVPRVSALLAPSHNQREVDMQRIYNYVLHGGVPPNNVDAYDLSLIREQLLLPGNRLNNLQRTRLGNLINPPQQPLGFGKRKSRKSPRKSHRKSRKSSRKSHKSSRKSRKSRKSSRKSRKVKL